jgi:Flp pilus assembly protein TadG
MHHVRTFCRPARQRGVAAVELGILLGVLTTLTFGITELGRAAYQYNAIAKGVRDAARYLSQQTPNTQVATAENLAVFGNITGTGAPLAPNLTVGMVDVCDRLSCAGTHNLVPTGAGVLNLVTVSVTGYTFTTMLSFVVPNITFGPIAATFTQIAP